MKFSSKERKVTSSQKTMAIELGLSDQKKAIELLYSQYSDPIQTCVQELVSNAFDAMQDANRSHVPIKVTLPNELNDFYFSVRDFGNSMDDNTIKNVYMRVNASTKSTSNKAIGGFGIGSKTPWAYTDTFILKTFLNGLETQYALVKGRSSVSIVYQGKTTQENGTEVVFKVKPSDKAEFENALERISLCAKVKPIVNSKVSLDFKNVDEITPSVRVISHDLLESKFIYANIGGVLYRIPRSLVEDTSGWNKRGVYTDIKKVLSSNSTLVVDFPIGSLLPLQTREGLFVQGEEGQQNKVTLKRVLDYSYTKLMEVIEARRKDVKSPKDAVNYFSNGMLRSQDSFTFGEIKISQSGVGLEHSFISTISRERRSGYGGPTANAKKSDTKHLYFKDARNCPIYFSELSANKARLNARLHKIAASTDVIVLQKERFNSDESYNFLKEFYNAKNIEEVEIPKKTSIRTGAKKDKTKIVYYDRGGSRFGELFTTDDHSNRTTTIVYEKDTYPKWGTQVIKDLGLKAIWVAKGNLEKVLELDNFVTEEEALDFDKIRDMYILHKYAEHSSNIKRKHEKFVLSLAGDHKQKMFNEGETFGCFYQSDNLVKKLYSLYGSAIDRAVKSMLKRRVRVANLVDKVPLVAHISNPNWIKGDAKKDLERYVIERIGG